MARRNIRAAVCLVWVCGIAVGQPTPVQTESHDTAPGEDLTDSARPESGERVPTGRKVEILRQATFLLVIIVLVFAVSLLAFRRWSRHYRARLLREPREATDAADVWAMHRLDETDDFQDDGIDASSADD